jgi:stage II sporulation protein R
MLKLINRNNRNHRAAIIELLLCSLWLFACVQLIPNLLDAYKQSREYEDGVIRVIANSNKASDVEKKEQVALDVENYFPNSRIDVEKWASLKYEKTLTYSIKQGPSIIPPKWVNGQFVPQTYAQATVISIGNARGDNWFCALFYKACGYKEKKEMEKSRWNKKWAFKT